MSESDVLKACTDVLDWHPAVGKWWRCPSGKVRVKGGYMQLAPAGTADITVVLRGSGRYLGVEVKKDGKKSTTSAARREVQAKFVQDIAAIGGRVVTVWSAAELVLVLNEIWREKASGT